MLSLRFRDHRSVCCYLHVSKYCFRELTCILYCDAGQGGLISNGIIGLSVIGLSGVQFAL